MKQIKKKGKARKVSSLEFEDDWDEEIFTSNQVFLNQTNKYVLYQPVQDLNCSQTYHSLTSTSIATLKKKKKRKKTHQTTSHPFP